MLDIRRADILGPQTDFSACLLLCIITENKAVFITSWICASFESLYDHIHEDGLFQSCAKAVSFNWPEL